MNLAALIHEHPFAHAMRPEHVQVLSQGACEATFEPGEILFRQGEVANRFYLVIEGQVELEAHSPADGNVTIQGIGPGEVVGWSWLFPPFIWQFQAKAVGRTRVVVLDGARLLIAANRDSEFGFELMRRVARVVIQRLQSTRERLLHTGRGPR